MKISTLSKRILNNKPKAFLWLLISFIVLNLISYFSFSLQHNSDKKTVFLIGDSFTGNYRFDEGDRLQDIIEKDYSEFQTFNLARPGARTLDMLMQLHQGIFLFGKPDKVILPIYSNKTLNFSDKYHRLDKRGDNLKWLQVSKSSERVYNSLDDEHKKKLLIHKLGLFTGFYDAFEYLFVNYLQWPKEREQAINSSEKRNAKIAKKNKTLGMKWSKGEVSLDAFNESKAMDDLNLLIKFVKDQNIDITFLILPPGNLDVVGDFNIVAKNKIHLSHRFMVNFMYEHDLKFIDLFFNFKGEWFDDFRHPIDPKSNEMISTQLKPFLTK
jgi:hypothetical protein